MLRVKTIEFFFKNLHENRVLSQEERKAFVLEHQHGLHDVTCMQTSSSIKKMADLRLFYFNLSIYRSNAIW